MFLYTVFTQQTWHALPADLSVQAALPADLSVQAALPAVLALSLCALFAELRVVCMHDRMTYHSK
jgi:hypothetical protein